MGGVQVAPKASGHKAGGLQGSADQLSEHGPLRGWEGMGRRRGGVEVRIGGMMRWVGCGMWDAA